MPIQEFNSKIEDFIGSHTVGKVLWPIYFGVEMEYEIDIKHSFVKDLISGVSDKEAESLVSINLNKVSPLTNVICDRLFPKIKEFAFIKRDGSLMHGLEIVTLPMSYDVQESFWRNTCSIVETLPLVVKPNCGMHVHMSREVLTTLQNGKMLNFLHNKVNKDFIIFIAGRTPPEDYSSISTPKKVTDIKRHGRSGSRKNGHDVERYDCFNTTGDKTIEFRFFLSSLSFEKIMANIQFCSALVDFCWPGNSSLQNLNFHSFIQFITRFDKRKQYAFLINAITGSKFLKKKVVPTQKSVTSQEVATIPVPSSKSKANMELLKISLKQKRSLKKKKEITHY